MKIAYVRRFFPENTETFLAEEIAELKRQGHQVRIYAENGRFSQIHRKVVDERLLDNVIYCQLSQPRTTGWLYNGSKLLQIIKNIWPRRGLFKNYYPHRQLACEFWGSLGKSLKGYTLTQASVRLISDIFHTCCLSFSVGNFSVAISQSIAEKAEFRPDVVHCPFTFRWDTHMIAQLLKTYPGTPFTVTLRSRELYTAVNDKVFANLRYNLLCQANQLITISEYNHSVLREAFPVRQNIPVIHSSIDLSFFIPKREIYEKRGNKIIAVARLVEKKGLKYLIEACAALRDLGIDFECKIIGQGPLEESLRKLINQHNLPGRVRIEGPLSREKIRDLLDEAKIFVLPCIVADDGDRDILPNSLKEAMAMSLPVVTSNISGINELVENGVEGMLVPPNSSQAIAGCVTALLCEPALCHKLGQAARSKIMRDFNIEIEGGKLSAVLSRVALEGRSATLRSVVKQELLDSILS